MIDNGLDFALVPWTQALDRHFGPPCRRRRQGERRDRVEFRASGAGSRFEHSLEIKLPQCSAVSSCMRKPQRFARRRDEPADFV
jgi:hypothetical protein